MSTAEWIAVIGFVAGGFVLGSLASRIVARVLARPDRPEPLRQAAAPVSSLVFWGLVVAGLLGALGVIRPESVDQLTADLVDFVPKALTAAVIIISANVLSSFASAAAAPLVARSSAGVQRRVMLGLRTSILVVAILLAVPTLGIDTTVVNLAVAAVFFGLAASFTLLVGLGGRSVAEEVASTRALRRLLSVGDRIDLGDGDVAGEVIRIHPTAIELGVDGSSVFVPSSHVLDERMVVRRAGGDRRPADRGGPEPVQSD